MNAKESIKNSLKILLLFTVITGFAYPVLIYGIGQLFFHGKANGSFIKKNGEVIGSKLIGQKFTSDKYFWPRPSAIDYNPMPSGGSNLALTSKTLLQQYNDNKSAFIKANMLNDTSAVPEDILFASASGVDPEISPEAALIQVERIAKVRKFKTTQKQKLYSLVEELTQKRQFGFLGDETVNVLRLNIGLDNIK